MHNMLILECFRLLSYVNKYLSKTQNKVPIRRHRLKMIKKIAKFKQRWQLKIDVKSLLEMFLSHEHKYREYHASSLSDYLVNPMS